MLTAGLTVTGSIIAQVADLALDRDLPRIVGHTALASSLMIATVRR